jgi:hypothetical protein
MIRDLLLEGFTPPISATGGAVLRSLAEGALWKASHSLLLKGGGAAAPEDCRGRCCPQAAEGVKIMIFKYLGFAACIIDIGYEGRSIEPHVDPLFWAGWTGLSFFHKLSLYIFFYRGFLKKQPNRTNPPCLNTAMKAKMKFFLQNCIKGIDRASFLWYPAKNLSERMAAMMFTRMYPRQELMVVIINMRV